MRQESAASMKGTRAHYQLAPREGTKLRALYDGFMEHKGLPFQRNLCPKDHRRIADLKDFYGLDIRMLKSGSGNRWEGSSVPGTWVLAGEWFGKTYVDYIADRIAKHERKERK